MVHNLAFKNEHTSYAIQGTSCKDLFPYQDKLQTNYRQCMYCLFNLSET